MFIEHGVSLPFCTIFTRPRILFKEKSMTTAKEYIQNTFELVKARNAHEAEFLQAVEEF